MKGDWKLSLTKSSMNLEVFFSLKTQGDQDQKVELNVNWTILSKLSVWD